MRLQLKHTEELLTRRTGLVLIDRFGKKHNLSTELNQAFPEPGSNRGIDAATYVMTLTEMMIDGATHLDDVQSFENDTAYKMLTEREGYPSSDALGVWLRRHGGAEGEQQLWSVTAKMVQRMTREEGLTADFDGTLIEADKGDAEMSYKGIRGYHPLLGACPEIGMFIGSRFQQGNASPQADLASFVHDCCTRLPGRINAIRMDSAGYNHDVINYCNDHHLSFTITADHDEAVMAAVRAIPATAWQQGRYKDTKQADYMIAETVHTMNETKEAFRLVVKRTVREGQHDLFDEGYRYWIVATNFSVKEKSAQEVIHHHELRGEMERMIGELKHQVGMDHLPCGQFTANRMYFTIGVFAYNLVQVVKREHFGTEWKRKTLRSFRYWWLHVASRITTHARYVIAHVAMAYEQFQTFETIYLGLVQSPAPS